MKTTIDKTNQTDLTTQEFLAQLAEIGLLLKQDHQDPSGQTFEIISESSLTRAGIPPAKLKKNMAEITEVKAAQKDLDFSNADLRVAIFDNGEKARGYALGLQQASAICDDQIKVSGVVISHKPRRGIPTDCASILWLVDESDECRTIHDYRT